MNIKKSIILRVRLAFLAVTLLGAAIVFKMGKIQFVDGSKWIALAQDIGLDYQVVKAARGNIYSDNGSLMATSLPFYRVAMDPSVAREEVFKRGLDSLSLKLSQYFKDKDRKTYKRILGNARSGGKK